MLEVVFVFVLNWYCFEGINVKWMDIVEVVLLWEIDFGKFCMWIIVIFKCWVVWEKLMDICNFVI